MSIASHSSLVKPTLDTQFYIDFDWWKQHDANWRIFLYDMLCEKHHKVFENQDEDVIIDYIDPETAEVKRVDGLLHTLMKHCAQQPEFISNSTSLVATVFRVFLSNGNQPLSPREISERTGKSARMILRTFSGALVFNGIRPYSKK
ncbi:MAG TPA: hypothetical protein G4N92_08725 [Anaerolineae bacterium]|nr:hypothetical protein [Anaerolineae bacterium]